MRFTRIEIDGFGPLRDFHVDVAPGLHMFHGPNEAGKSTLQQSILALLYGFYESDRARPTENVARERFVPWNGGSYAARLEYELANGSRYRVQRDFSTADVPTAIWDLHTGRDVTDDFGRGRHGNVPFARRQLGMTKRVFDACVFVSQGELFELAEERRASPQEIGDTIISLADSARRDVSAQSALERLERIVQKRVGGPRARAAPLPVARQNLGQAQGELKQIDSARAELSGDAIRLDRAGEKCEDGRGRLARSRYLLLQAEISEIERETEQFSALDQERERLQRRIAETEPFATFPREERDDILRRWQRIGDLRGAIDEERPAVERATKRLGELTEQRAPLARRQEELSHLRGFATGDQTAIEEFARTWREARRLAENARQRARESRLAPELLAEYERLRSEVEAFQEKDIEVLTRKLRVPESAWRQVFRAVGRTVVAALRWVRRQIAASARRTLRAIVRRPVKAVQAEEGVAAGEAAERPLAALSANEAAELLDLHRRYLRIAPQVAHFQEEEARVAEADADLEAAAAELREALEGLVEDRADLERALRVVAGRRDGLRELLEVDGKLADLDRERSALLERQERFQDDDERLRRTEAALRDHLREATQTDGGFQELLEAFEDGVRRCGEHEVAEEGLRENGKRRGILLSGRTPRALEETLNARRTELGMMLARHPELEGAETGATVDELRSALDQQDKALNRLELEIRELETKINTRMSRLRHRAELEEEIEHHQQEVERLERFGEALGTARDTIEEAMTEAHRNFVPSVGRFLSEGVASVTSQRYDQVYLDPSTLRLTAEIPETKRIEDVELLSRGTRAAAYLLLRIGLAQHMSAMREPIPLILDDPLVDLDDVRTERFLELLLDLTKEVQILLFVKDDGVRMWFERRCSAERDRHAMTSLLSPAAR